MYLDKKSIVKVLLNWMKIMIEINKLNRILKLFGKILGDYKLIRTSSCCPEQYDVYKNNKMVGYLRLRNGHLMFHRQTLTARLSIQ